MNRWICLRQFFPSSHSKSRDHECRVLSGIIFVNRNGPWWRDALWGYGPHKTLWKRWGDVAIFTRMVDGLSAAKAEPQTMSQADGYLPSTSSRLSLLPVSRASPSDWESHHDSVGN